MQFQVPQFIEIEDKIFGPLTFKQFIYLLGGAGFGYLVWRAMPLYIAAPISLAFVGLAVALAFLEWNGRPFIVALEHAFYYVLHPKLYLWSNTAKQAPKAERAAATLAAPDVYIPTLSESKLHTLAWSLDINERIDEGSTSSQRAGSEVAGLRTARSARV